MKYIDSGYGKIPLISLMALLSISLTVNLPGLAISPIMGKLNQVFTHVTELEIQLLTVLPNVVTIPFILCSGKICTPKNQMFILGIGLTLYTLTGVLYFFANTMVQLIILSCLLGVGCGLVIPLAASLLSQYTVGAARTKALGWKSGVSNFTVIFATLFVGWVAAISWHMAFIVYMVPIIPLCLIPFMTANYIDKHKIVNPAPPAEPRAETPPTKQDIKTSEEKQQPVNSNFHFQGRTALLMLAGIMAVYLVATYGTEVVSYYLPFAMEDYHLSTADVGVATAMFFASATCSGFLLSRIIKLLGTRTMQIAIIFMVVGLFFVAVFHAYWCYVVGVFIMGLGYGVVQPVIYDKTAFVAPTAAKSTAYFSYLLTCNYIGISIVPFIIGAARRLFNANHDPSFAFFFNGVIIAILLILSVIYRKSFVFKATAPANK